jgi:hypothetical protein
VKRAVIFAVFLVGCLSSTASAGGKPTATIQRIAVVNGKTGLQVEITTSRPITAQTQTAIGPDRLVVDFPEVLPSGELHEMLVNRGNLKAVRVGLHSANPPVTRVVLDLRAPQQYQVAPSGNSIVLVLGASERQPAAPNLLSPPREAMPAESLPVAPVRPGRKHLPATMPGTPAASAATFTTLRRVAVLGGQSFELEIVADHPIMPQTQVVEDPHRLIVDFPDTVPGPALHDVHLHRADVRGVRVGLFSAHPPVTRVVVDLNSRPQFELFPSGKSVIVKLTGNGSPPANRPTPSLASLGPPPTVAPLSGAIKVSPHLRVSLQGGQLSVVANGASLSEVLYEVHRQTGADIPIPSGAEKEKVVTDLGPGPARDVLADLLNGSPFDFVIVGSQNDPAQVSSVQLTLREGGAGPEPPTNAAVSPEADPTPDVAPQQPEPVPEPQPDAQPAPPAPPQQIPPQQAPQQ